MPSTLPMTTPSSLTMLHPTQCFIPPPMTPHLLSIPDGTGRQPGNPRLCHRLSPPTGSGRIHLGCHCRELRVTCSPGCLSAPRYSLPRRRRPDEHPGTVGGSSWAWRVRKEALNEEVATHLRHLTQVYRRLS